MTVRRPLIYDRTSGNLIEMTTAQVNSVIDLAVYLYGSNPSVTLSQVSSGGSLAGMNDSRMRAGAGTTDVTNFDTAGETPSIDQQTASIAVPRSGDFFTGGLNEGSYPFFYQSTTGTGDIRAMNRGSVIDTFIEPAIAKLVLGSTTTEQAGTYTIGTSTSLAGATLVSSTPVFTDTRADTSKYTAGGIPETLDQPKTINNYYLHRIDPGTKPTTIRMLRQTASGDLQEFTEAQQENVIGTLIRWAVVSSGGNRIRYNVGTTGSGQTRGSGMTDTKLSGSGNYQQRFVNTNDYRTQEFPNGSSVAQNTYYLRIERT